jgi:cytochrome b
MNSAGQTMEPAAAATPSTARSEVPVWDRFVRFFHWSLVVSFATAWWFTESVGWIHKGAGYVALALVTARIVWGFTGRGHARFASFVPTPSGLAAYLAALARGRAPRHLGHNPAGAVMILGLLLAVLTISISGWLMTTDAFWGNELVETVHTVAVDVALWAVAVHVLANLLHSLRHRDNLILAMITGRKRSGE